MNRLVLHIDFNSYFATVEQQANPRLRGKPIGVTGGDRLQRTVLGAASVEAKKFGVKTGMQLWEAKNLCPNLILVPGDSDKYLECTKRFLNILKDYSPNLEVFSIDECFLELSTLSSWSEAISELERLHSSELTRSSEGSSLIGSNIEDSSLPSVIQNDSYKSAVEVAQDIKQRIRKEVGDWITCSIGISYNKIMAKLAGSLYKPDGLVVIEDPQAAEFVLDRTPLDEICGIGPRIKRRLFSMGITDFKKLRGVPKELLLASFKSYGENLYNWSRGEDFSPVEPFFLKEEVKSIGHRHTLFKDTDNLEELKQTLLKISEMIAKRLREKRMVGRTVNLWFRYSFIFPYTHMEGDGKQCTITFTQDGLDIFKAAYELFLQLWDKRKVRMVGASISNLKPKNPHTISLLAEDKRKEIISTTLDKMNDKFGEFTLQRGILLTASKMKRKPNPYLSDRRFKI